MKGRDLEPDEIRLRVHACGVCGTDSHPLEDAEPQPFGHEVAGTIVETGSAVTRLETGQKVALDSATPCGRCNACRNAKQELCSDIQSFFLSGTFGFAEEMIAPSINAMPCADLEPAAASLSEPLGVAIDLVRLTDIQPDSNVLIMGQGPIGLMAQALVRHAGANRVVVTEMAERKARREAAEKLGADRVLCPKQTPLAETNVDVDIDRILVTAPPDTLSEAFDIAAKGAIISFIGIAFGERAMCRFNANDFHFKKLQLRASFASPALYGPLALDCLRRGIINPDLMISHHFALDDIDAALRTARQDPDAIKVVVHPNG